MSRPTSIEWCTDTWNPVTGCTRVSAGCDNCYAARQAATRLSHTRQYQGLATITPSGRAAFNGTLRFLPERLEDPLRWRKPRRIFVNSMSDLFHEAVPDDFIDQVFAVMCWARHHTFLVLTKRPERMRAYMQSRVRREWVPPAGTVPPHVWLGVSVEDQATADARIPVLLETPAAVRWVSAEPLLGPIDLIAWVSPFPGVLDWVVVGGESGPFARPFDLTWARDLSAQCAAAGVPVFVKQLGAKPVDSDYLTGRSAPEDRRSIERATALGRPLDCQPNLVLLNDRKGGDLAEFPRELQVREYPA